MRGPRLALILSSLILSSLILAGCASTAGRGGGSAPALMGSASDTAAPGLARIALQNDDLRALIHVDAGVGAAMIDTWSAPAAMAGNPLLAVAHDMSEDAPSWALTESLQRAVESLDQVPRKPLAEGAETTDPLGDVFVGNMEDYHVPRDRLVPFSGSLDLSKFHNGSFYGRVWTMDTYMKGLGFGISFPIGYTPWQAAAEVGFDWRGLSDFPVDPFSTIEEGDIQFLFGISRRF